MIVPAAGSARAAPFQRLLPAVDRLPLSALNDYAFCGRRAWLKMVEGVRSANEHTLLGDLAHEHVDHPGFEQRAGWELQRALPLYSDRLGLSGKADLVELRREGGDRGRILEVRPVEYKKGPARRYDNDEIQLCAQALCLEEMLGIPVSHGAIFHARSQRRTEVEIDAQLRARTLAAISGLKLLISQPVPPSAELLPSCEGCSLHEVCVPEAAGVRSSRLFEPRAYS